MHSTPKWEYIVLYLIPLGTICGNVLVCMAVYLERRLRHRFNLFLVSLAISDLLCALLVMPVSAWQMITEQVLERVEIPPVINLTVPWNVSLRSATESAEVTKSYKGCGPNDPSFVLTAIGVTFVLPLIIMTTTYVLTVRTLQQHMEQVKAIRQHKPTNVHTTSRSQTPYLKRVHSERVPTTGRKPSILLRNLSARGMQPGSTNENTQQSQLGFQRSFLWTPDIPSGRKKISDPTKGKSQFEIPDRGNLTAENQEAESSVIYQLDKNHSNEEQILVVQDTDSPGTDIKLTVYHDYQCVTSTDRNNNGVTNYPSYARIHSGKRAVRVIGVLFGLFVTCYLPFFIIYIIDVMCTKCKSWTTIVIPHLEWLGYLSSMLNPVVYHSFNSTFRRTFRRIFRCACRSIPDHHAIWCRRVRT
ncbi:hypothetical protein FGIG_03715 [Fasciola gigantica]|uniref:G-protein coupled receptors family 1 profile domain-containing protein n=1 Tax=Fasciola gigantica TaxID=46835 RepID=A0A504XT20_FASGI|nr:hypothetical protein FGIG_03715 [Fasciola gigantica]